MGRRKRNRINKEEIAEACCFVCKEGGWLRICDYKNCLKGFHPVCVERDDSMLKSDENWVCNWHFCLLCSKTAKFRCFCCPFAVCGRCLWDADFALVKGLKGFCNNCLDLALLIDDKKDANTNGVQLDFNDRETYESLFKDYWDFIKGKEGLTLTHLHSASRLLKEGNNYEGENASDCEDDIDQLIGPDSDDSSDSQVRCRKKKKAKLPLTKRNGKSKKMEFHGWASKQLTEFLTSVGKNTVQELSQQDVATIVIEYCKEYKLFHPEKKKKVICDEKLQSLLGRKAVNRNGIYKLLTIHLAENLELSDSEEFVEFSSKQNDDDILVPCKRQQKSSPTRKFEEKAVALTPQEGYLAAIVSRNIKLVYLKRSLVQELAKQLDNTFHVKMIGSFVRVKSDPHDYLQKNSHMLVKVKGIKETSMKEDMNSIFDLEVSNMLNYVPISKLSDDDFTEEECEDLYERMRTGRLERPTVVELEQKAKSLHEDITKHWITKELVLLQNHINRANEKGWRKELLECMDRMLLLQTSSEQSRLIHEIPEVVVDVSEPVPASDDSPRENNEECKASSEPTLGLVSKIQTSILENAEVSCCVSEGMDASEGKRQLLTKCVSHDNCPAKPVPQLLPQGSPDCQTCTVYLEKQPGDAAREKLNHPVEMGEHIEVGKQIEVIELSDEPIEVIELSDDDEKLAPSLKFVSQKTLEDRDWYCISPNGELWGPYALTVLKAWSLGCSEFEFKVMRRDQRPEEAILLTDAIRKYFNC